MWCFLHAFFLRTDRIFRWISAIDTILRTTAKNNRGSTERLNKTYNIMFGCVEIRQLHTDTACEHDTQWILLRHKQ